MNPLNELQRYGQSFWYDNIRRKYLLDGTIKTLITEDGLRGMTSNPTIFEHAIGAGNDYDEQIADLSASGLDVEQIYEELALFDIRLACDLFSELYERSSGGDGYVSLEVSPHLAHDETGTTAEALRLFDAVDRPNVMIKVPATPEGIPAIRELIGQGINVNVTLMFSQDHYEAVAGAYIKGVADSLDKGGNPERIASVASFFVSRVDSAVDRQLTTLNDPAANLLLGKAAIANSKLVYQRFKDLFHGQTFFRQQSAGANAQRLLWASTSTKNPDYPDTLYVDELIGPETVNTMPPKTIDAFRDHGRLRQTLEDNVEEASLVLDNLIEMEIDLDDITEELQRAGVQSFAHSFDSLLDTLSDKVSGLSK